MRVFWWQTGLHIEPENKKEFKALMLLTGSLHLIDLDQAVVGSPSANSGDQQSVIAVNERL